VGRDRHLCARRQPRQRDRARTRVEANDFAGLFAACPNIGHIFFNGAAAETAFRRHVRGRIALPALHFARLPSTSPAHAARGLAAKLAAWQAVKDAAGSGVAAADRRSSSASATSTAATDTPLRPATTCRATPAPRAA